MLKIFCVPVLSLLVLLCSISPSLAADSLTVAGDPCSIALFTKLAEKAEKVTKTKFEVKKATCTLGVFMAADGDADVGVSTQNGLDENLPKGAVNNVIALSPIVLVVHKSNPVDNLSYEQLKGIQTGKITNWKEVGGKDIAIKSVLLEPCVKHTMGKKIAPYGDIEEIRPGEKINPVDGTNKFVSENEAAIGQQIYGYESTDVKVLKIDGLLPNPTNTPDKYIFYQDYNVVTKGTPKGAVKKLLEFARSKEGKKVITSMKHIPVTK